MNQKASDVGFWCFICCQPEQVVEQTVELPVIWDMMMLMYVIVMSNLRDVSKATAEVISELNKAVDQI